MMKIVLALALSTATAFFHGHSARTASRTTLKMSKWGPDWDLKPESLCIHGGWSPDPTTTSRAVPVYRAHRAVLE